MSYIEGIGDEVTYFFGGILVIICIFLVWISTAVPTRRIRRVNREYLARRFALFRQQYNNVRRRRGQINPTVANVPTSTPHLANVPVDNSRQQEALRVNDTGDSNINNANNRDAEGNQRDESNSRIATPNDIANSSSENDNVNSAGVPSANTAPTAVSDRQVPPAVLLAAVDSSHVAAATNEQTSDTSKEKCPEDVNTLRKLRLDFLERQTSDETAQISPEIEAVQNEQKEEQASSSDRESSVHTEDVAISSEAPTDSATSPGLFVCQYIGYSCSHHIFTVYIICIIYNCLC